MRSYIKNPDFSDRVTKYPVSVYQNALISRKKMETLNLIIVAPSCTIEWR